MFGKKKKILLEVLLFDRFQKQSSQCHKIRSNALPLGTVAAGVEGFSCVLNPL